MVGRISGSHVCKPEVTCLNIEYALCRFPMVQLTQTSLLANPEDASRLKQEFATTGCALLPGFLSPSIVNHLMEWTARTRFEERNEFDKERGVFGTTLLASETEPVVFLLRFILNRPELYRFSEQITGCPRIANYLGRLHRTTANVSQHIDWHRDLVDGRVLGLCINLSVEPYTGGMFQMRDPGQRVTATVARGAIGDAFLFRIDDGWQHRLTSVESGSRTVGVGWFRTAPEWKTYAPTISRSRPSGIFPQRAGR